MGLLYGFIRGDTRSLDYGSHGVMLQCCQSFGRLSALQEILRDPNYPGGISVNY